MTTTTAPRAGFTTARRPGAAAAPTGGSSQVASLLTSTAFQEQVKLALPKHIGADKFLRVVLTELRKNPKLAECDKASFAAALMASAQLGLEVGSTLGLAYLIPRRNSRQGITECQFQLGYKGMLQLIRNSGEVSSVSIRSVGANDEFSYSYGLHEDLRHVPSTGDSGPMAYVYAVVRMKDGAVQFDVMSRAQVESVRDKHGNVSGSSSPWVSHFEEMAKKTVLRRLFKYLPVGTELAAAVALDEAGERSHNEMVGAMVAPAGAAELPSQDPAGQLMPGEVIASAPATISAEQQAAINTAIQNLGITDLGLQTIAADLAQRGIDSVSKLPAEHFSWFMSCLQDPAAVEHWQAGLSLDGDRLVEESPATPAAPEQPAAPAPAPAPATRQVVRRGKAKAEPQQPADPQQAAPADEPVQAELTATDDPDPFQGAG